MNRSLAFVPLLLLFAVACDDTANEAPLNTLSFSVENASMETCNDIFAGVSVTLNVTSLTDAAQTLTAVEVRAAGGEIMATFALDPPQTLAGQRTVSVVVREDDCDNPEVTFSPPSQSGPFTATFTIHATNAGEAASASTTDELVFGRAFDSCIAGFGVPGSGCTR
ncbi:MAG: hypothetical protein ACI9MR_003807 [Myxococcota bacterium]|jgi:hypothetical protein